MALLEIDNLSLEIGVGAQSRRLVDGLSLTVDEGESVCLIGESGSGKSVTALALTRLLPCPPFQYAGGAVALAGRSILDLDEAALREIRGGVVSYVFQDPVAYLNPVHRVGTQILEMLRLHRPDKATRGRVIELLELVGIPAAERRVDEYPHQLSGGMLQRVMIAMALAPEPRLLVADEPTTALDVTIQAQILALLNRLRMELGMAVLLISHNLGVVADVGDRVAVMYAGQIVEWGPADQVLSQARHPYTQALLRAVPSLERCQESLEAIPGQVPEPGQWPTGCRFHPRCPHQEPSCRTQEPSWAERQTAHSFRCPVLASL